MIHFYKLFLFSAFLLNFLTGCGPDKQSFFGERNVNKCSLDTSSLIRIPNKDIIQGLYRYAQYVESENLFVGYNHLNNRLECVNLESLKVDKIIPLSSEGPISVPNFMSFYYHNSDSIFLLGAYKLVLINDKGDAHFTENLNREGSKFKGLDFSQFSIYNDPNNNQPIYFNSNDQKLYFAIKSFGDSRSNTYYQNPLCGRLNLTDFKIESIPMYYADEYKKGTVFYPLDKPNILFMNNKIVYSFKNKSDIYEFNLVTQKTTLHKCPSSYTTNEVKSLSNNQRGDQTAMMKHMSSNPEYKFVLFDPYAGLYYRFHLGPYPYLDEPDAIGKRGYLYLSVMDTSFKMKHESQLPLNYRYFGATPTPMGLLIKTRDQDEAYNTYTLFKYKCD